MVQRVFYLEQVFVVEFVRDGRGNPRAFIFDDELLFGDRSRGKEAEAGFGAADTKGSVLLGGHVVEALGLDQRLTGGR